MPPKRPVRRSLPTPRKSRPKSETPSRDGSSSPDPLDIISNKGSPESQRRQSVYISTSDSKESGSESEQSSSSSLQHTPKTDDTENSSSSDSQDSVKDQFRRQRRYSDGLETENESESEDEWSHFLSSSAKKQRQKSARSSIESDASSTRSSTADTENTSTPTTSQTEWPLIPVATLRPFQLNPVRIRPMRMVDDQMHEAEVKAENVVQAEGNGEDVGMNTEVDLVQEAETTLPAHGESHEEPMRQEDGEEAQPQIHGVEAGIIDIPEESETVDKHTAEEEKPAATEAVENDTQAHEVEEPVDDTKDSTSDNVEHPPVATSEIPTPADIDIQPETNTGMEVETVPEVQRRDDAPQAEVVNHAPPVVDAQTSGGDQQMAENYTPTDPADDIPASIPAGTSVAGIEEGEEELDEETAPTPEAEAEAEVDITNADIEMDGSSAPADPAPVAEAKIRKKPGPKPKPKQVGQKVEAAVKKAIKGTKGKKVDELKSTSKKNARFTPESNHPSSASAASEQAEDTPEPASDRTYCVCRKKESDDDEDVTMVGCESCDDWFHASCVGLTEDQVKNMDVYICRSCERSTKQKTIFKKTCKRDGCVKGLGMRESKFCSDLCAYKYFKVFTDSVTNKKTLKALSTSFGSFPKPVPIQVIHHGEARPVSHVDNHTQQLISAVQQQLTATTAALEIVRKRQQILQIAIDKAESLPPIIVQAEERSGKSKRKGGGGPTEDKQCAWDPRLIWDDEEVGNWVEGEEDEVEICGLGKRRCDKHSGWQKTSGFSLETEEIQLSQKQKTLASQEESLAKAVETAAESDKAKSEFKERLVAKGKA